MGLQRMTLDSQNAMNVVDGATIERKMCIRDSFWFTPTRTGTFEVLCSAFCGIGHPEMRGTVVVENESDYQAWLQKQQTFAQLSAHAKKVNLTQ